MSTGVGYAFAAPGAVVTRWICDLSQILRIQAAILVSTGLASDRRFIASSGRVKRHVETVPAIDGDNRQCELRRFNLVEFLCRPCCRPRLEPVVSQGVAPPLPTPTRVARGY